MNIVEKASKNALAKNERKIIREVSKRTGFAPKKELFRGKIIYTYGHRPVTGSILLLGRYNGNEAVLKLQGLRLESSEVDMIRRFESQNRSRVIRAPKIYKHAKWNPKAGYGYTIMEYVEPAHIYEMPFAMEKQMREFARVFQEYKTRAVRRPWVRFEPGNLYSGGAKGVDNLSSVINTVEKWRKNAEKNGRLKFDDYATYLIRFYPIAAGAVPKMKAEFMQKDFTQQSILKKGGTYIMFSNALWGYRLEWSELAYVLWYNLLGMKSGGLTFGRTLKYIKKWINVYKAIPIFRSLKADKRLRSR